MQHLKSTVFALGLAAFIPTTGFTQTSDPEPATTFADLAIRLPAESFLIVTDQQGRRSSGKLIGLEPDALSIRADRALLFKESEVQHVQRKIPDSVKDGGFLGFAIGMIVPMAVCMTRSDSSETPSCVIYSIGFGGLPGFAIGAIVDSYRGRKVTLFRASSPAP